jgi:hypothetical protein
MLRYRSVLLAVAFLVAPSWASAVTYTWPGAAPCATTLASCVNAVAAGSVVEIATTSPIDENVVFNKSLTVRAAPGFKPTFAPTRYLWATSSAAAAFNVTFEGLTLTDGDVVLSRTGTGDGSFVVRRMRLLNSDPASYARIMVSAVNTGTLDFDIAENEVHTQTTEFNANSISVNAAGPTATGTIRFNRLTAAGSGSIVGIGAGAPAGTLQVDVFANEIRGNFPGGAIRITTSFDSPSGDVTARLVDNVIVGTGGTPAGTSYGAQVIVANGSITATAANNTITATRSGLFYGTLGGATGTLTGHVGNNLVAFNNRGLDLATFEPNVTNSRNLVFGNGGGLFTPGTGTVASDPQLLSVWYPRLRAGSPAINAGDATFIQQLLALNGLPQVDADGMRRTIGGGALGVDIGAYEFGDVSFAAVKAGGSGNDFALNHPALDGLPSRRPLLTKNFSVDGVNGATDPYAIGVYYTGGLWRAFNQGLETMPAATAMNVLVPGLGGAYGASYAHVATGANTFGHFTTLDDSYLNGTADAIVLATSHWNASGTGVYNDHHIAVGAFGSWFVLNQDGEDIPLDAGFNIYAQDPSPNAYVHTVAAHNVSLAEASVLDHPLLNGVPCAQVHVTQRVGSLNDHPYDVFYQGGRWIIYNQDVAPMPLGIQFFVVVNPRQVFECTDVIFRDGYDS